MDKTYQFIVNTHSRTGKAVQIWENLENILWSRNVSYQAHITEYAGHATDLAASLTQGDEDVYLITCGGDGTVNEVLNGIRDLSKVVFGYIPLGSANDFAKGLHLEGEPEEILIRILDSTGAHAIDLGCVSWEGGSRRFCISAGAGIDAMVCRRALTSKLKVFLNHLHLGSLTYGLLTISSLFGAPFVNANVVTNDGRSLSMPKAIFSAAMNFPWEGGGVPMAPKASATDGKLSVCCVYGIPRLLCLLCFPFLLAGKHENIKGFDVVDATEIKVTFDKPMVVHADGEDCGDLREVTFMALPDALRMPMV